MLLSSDVTDRVAAGCPGEWMHGGHLADHQSSDPAVPHSQCPLAGFCSFNSCKQVLIEIRNFFLLILVGAYSDKLMEKTMLSFSKQGCKTPPAVAFLWVRFSWPNSDKTRMLHSESLWKWKNRLKWEVRRCLPTFRRHSEAWTDFSAENALILWSILLSSGVLFQNHRVYVFSPSECNKTWAVMQQ